MQGKRILLGITGGIAAYKIAYLIRILIKLGAEVKCIMTPASSDFISPLVVSTLSKNPVGIEFWNKSDGTWNNHVDYGIWADVLVIAPLTANSLSKMAHGGCDNLLLATYLSMKSETIVAPAMDLDMYKHPSTVRNFDLLKNDGVQIIPAGIGELASGLEGEGRMAEPAEIVKFIDGYFESKNKTLFAGKKVLITAGPTHEAIDPVRFIGNHSSGKMGYELAEAFVNQGAHVILISGPSSCVLRNDAIELVKVTSADDMLIQVQKFWNECDIGVFSAAVADYKPSIVSGQKIKKDSSEMSVSLVRNPDILKWAGDSKVAGQVLVGFALETSNLIENGTKKLHKKNLDCIVLNTLEDEGAGFATDTNKISILDTNNNLESFELKSKAEVASDILSYLKKMEK